MWAGILQTCSAHSQLQPRTDPSLFVQGLDRTMCSRFLPRLLGGSNEWKVKWSHVVAML